MNNVLDQRNNSNWPLTVWGVGGDKITATMAGDGGLNDVTEGQLGQGLVTDAIGNSYHVKLPAVWKGGNLTVDFERMAH